MRRLFDIAVSLCALVVLAPILAVILFLVWRQDRHTPFYVATRAARGGGTFRMVKIRSMVVNADRSGVESTGTGDKRITPLGHFIRRFKIDEAIQLWNVLIGDMSLVGPRPNTMIAVDGYSPEQMQLLDVRPGITDFSSIVFSDEGDVIKDYADADGAYNRLIWPWKAKLGLLYVQNASVLLNIWLIYITVIAIRDRRAALKALQNILRRYTTDERLLLVAHRDLPLEEFAKL